MATNQGANRAKGQAIRWGLAGLFALTIAFAGPTLARFWPSDAQKVEIHGPVEEEDSEAAPMEPLRVLVASMISTQSTLELYGGMVRQLGTLVGRRGVLVQRRSYSEANEAIRHGDVDLAFVCSGAFIESTINGDYAELVAVPVVRGKSTYQAYIIVAADSPWRHLAGMRGRSVAYVDPKSLTGREYLRHRVAALASREGPFFRRIVYTGSHDRSIEAVARGLVDVASVDHLIFEMMKEQQPEIGQRVRILERSPPFGAPPVVVPRSKSLALRTALRAALIGLHKTEEGPGTLRELKIDRFEPVTKEHYASVIALWGKAP